MGACKHFQCVGPGQYLAVTSPHPNRCPWCEVERLKCALSNAEESNRDGERYAAGNERLRGLKQCDERMSKEIGKAIVRVMSKEASRQDLADRPDPRHQFLQKYDAACRELTECRTVLDAKRVADKAEALAALAKICADGASIRQAKALRLKAFREMGDLAKEVEPKKRARGGKGGTVGPGTILKANGLSRSEANAALTLSRVTQKEFDALENRRRIPSPTGARGILDSERNDEAKALYALKDLHTRLGATNPGKLKRYAATQPNSKLIEHAEEVRDFLDMLLQGNN